MSKKQVTWLWFLGILAVAFWLDTTYQERHISKILFFASFGVWARHYYGLARYLLLGMVSLGCLLIIVPWYQYRNQRLIPQKDGSFIISNK